MGASAGGAAVDASGDGSGGAAPPAGSEGSGGGGGAASTAFGSTSGGGGGAAPAAFGSSAGGGAPAPMRPCPISDGIHVPEPPDSSWSNVEPGRAASSFLTASVWSASLLRASSLCCFASGGGAASGAAGALASGCDEGGNVSSICPRWSLEDLPTFGASLHAASNPQAASIASPNPVLRAGLRQPSDAQITLPSPRTRPAHKLGSLSAPSNRLYGRRL